MSHLKQCDLLVIKEGREKKERKEKRKEREAFCVWEEGELK